MKTINPFGVFLSAIIFFLFSITGQAQDLFGPQQIISNEHVGGEDFYMSVIDCDGDMDVLAVFFWGNNIIWYENDGN
ncbi:MAG: hypothetical protein AB8B69_25970, partial [Chitinophagales bacterium]